VYQTTGALTARGATASGSATHTPPVYTGAGAWIVGNATFAGSATFAASNIRTATGALTAAAASFSGSATFAGGTVVVPDPGDVRAGIVYDQGNLPTPGQVRAGVVYG